MFLNYIRTKKKRNSLLKHIGILFIAVTLSTSINYFYNNVIKQHQKNRISLWLRLENNPEEIEKMKRTILYNLNESEKAISSGGWMGKGYLEGT